MKRVHPLWLAALAVSLLVAGVVMRPQRSPESLALDVAPQLLDLVPTTARNGGRGTSGDRPLWKTLLERAALAAPDGTPTLKLGRIHADPTIARQAAEAAGELLLLPAMQGATETGVPLWKALLDGPAATRSEGGTAVKLYGCRFTADIDAAAAIEDTYHARLALARALREIVAQHPEYGPLTIEGEETPVQGGANFEVQLVDDAHMLEITVDRAAAAALGARRTWRPGAPNDEAARRAIVGGLRARAGADPAFARLVIEGEAAPVPGGVDVRIEALYGRLALDVKLSDGSHLSASRPWTPP